MSTWGGFPLRLLIAGLAMIGLASAQPAIPDPTLIEIETGAVRGYATNGVIGFKGIPYAAPPVGDLRWRAPQPARQWPGVRAAMQFGPACMQAEVAPASEDCLTINVWRPASASSAPLPVMVWIHGGALVYGAASLYPAESLARQGVVVVSMNYRLGRFGFFAHPALSREASSDPRGNYGFMDQRAALQWVQRNIAAFGGDPKTVAVFGESSGGGSVMVHLTSSMSRDLFQRAILQSPATPSPRSKVFPLMELAEAEKTGAEFARSVGVTGDGAESLTALRALPADKLVEGVTLELEIVAQSTGKLIAGFPGAIRDGKLVAEPPEEAFAAGRQARIPILVGATDRDLSIGTAKSKDELFAQFGGRETQARELYDAHGDQPLGELRQQVFADRTMTEPARHLAGEASRAGQPVWLYRFSYVAESQRRETKGATHAAETPYAFNDPAMLVGDRATMADKAMGEITSAYWVQFALTGNPNGGGRPEWPPYDPAADRIMNFTNSGAVAEADPLKSRLDLWRLVWSEDRH